MLFNTFSTDALYGQTLLQSVGCIENPYCNGPCFRAMHNELGEKVALPVTQFIAIICAASDCQALIHKVSINLCEYWEWVARFRATDNRKLGLQNVLPWEDSLHGICVDQLSLLSCNSRFLVLTKTGYLHMTALKRDSHWFTMVSCICAEQSWRSWRCHRSKNELSRNLQFDWNVAMSFLSIYLLKSNHQDCWHVEKPVASLTGNLVCKSSHHT